MLIGSVYTDVRCIGDKLMRDGSYNSVTNSIKSSWFDGPKYQLQGVRVHLQASWAEQIESKYQLQGVRVNSQVSWVEQIELNLVEHGMI